MERATINGKANGWGLDEENDKEEKGMRKERREEGLSIRKGWRWRKPS